VPQALLALHGQAVIASTLILPEQSEPLDDPDDVLQALKGQVDTVVDAGPCPAQASTVVDLTPMANEQAPVLLRRGAGDPALIGLGE
jgi:tRNA A37 threonylcarbamoyladenosine synthetase subunit TsaC/SUA5/YrdC